MNGKTAREASLELDLDLEKNLEEKFGPEGAAAMKEGIRIYQEYSLEDLMQNPGLGIEAAERTAELVDIIMAGYMKCLQRDHISKKGLLKTDPTDIFIDNGEKIFKKLIPKVLTEDKKEKPEDLFVIHISERIVPLISALMVVNEEKYRKRMNTEMAARRKIEEMIKRIAEINKKARNLAPNVEAGVVNLDVATKKLEQLSREKEELKQKIKSSPFVQESGIPGKIIIRTGGCFAERYFHEVREDSDSIMAVIYRLLKRNLKPLFEGTKRIVERAGTDLKKRKEENERIFDLIKKESVREVVLCTADNKTLFERTLPVTIQLSPIDESAGRTYWYLKVQVNYHFGENAKKIKTDRAAQQRVMAKPSTRSEGEAISEMPTTSIGFYLDRFKGQLRTLGVFPESLKIIDPSGTAAEFFRRDILIYLAQLTCSPETLVKIFGENFFGDPRKKEKQLPGRPEDPEGNPREEEPPKNNIAERQYPYGFPEDTEGKAQAVFQILTERGVKYVTQGEEINTDFIVTPEMVRILVEKTLRQVGERVSHRRLLPLIRKAENQNGKIVFEITGACRPSDEAKEKAKKAGRILKKGIEFVGMSPAGECVFYPEEVDTLLSQFGVQTLEEIEQKFPGVAFIRYETYVDPEKKEGALPIVAHIRQRTDEAAKNEQK